MGYNRNFKYISLTEGENLDVSNEALENLNDKSWVAIISEYDSHESQVIVFNNEQAPDNFCYSDFKEFGELMIGEYGKHKHPDVTYGTNLHQYSGIKLDREGLECQVIDIYNGGITKDTIQKFVNENHSGMKNVISDEVDAQEHQAELARERRFRP